MNSASDNYLLETIVNKLNQLKAQLSNAKHSYESVIIQISNIKNDTKINFKLSKLNFSQEK